MSLKHLFSRLRLAAIKPAEHRHPNAPLIRSAAQLNGPFIQTTLPSWAANTLERQDLPRAAAAFISNRGDTGAAYLVHGLQCGDLQLRIVIPVACPGATALFTHLAEHERASVVCDIDESTQSVELAITLYKQAAATALTAAKVPMTEDVFQDESDMLFALVHSQSVPSLISGHNVNDVLVLFCADPASLAARNVPPVTEGHQGFNAKMH